MDNKLIKRGGDRFGLRSHGVPLIIAIAYLVDSIDTKMTLLRIMTLILAAIYVAVIVVSGIQMIREKLEIRRSKK